MILAARPVLRDYQLDLVERLRGRFAAGHRRVLGVAPTGSGKAVLGAAIVEGAIARGRRVGVFAHRIELIDQLSAKLDSYGLDHGVIKPGHPRLDLRAPVQVVSVPTMARRLHRASSYGFDFLVFDECHHMGAASWLSVLNAFPAAPALGLTATPYRQDGKGLGDVFEVLEAGPQVAELIRAGWLVQPQVLAPPPPDELANVRVQAGEYVMGSAAEILDATAPTSEIVQTWLARARGRTTVGFACTVAHAGHLAEAFRAAGVAAAAIDGETPEAERNQVLRDLAAGRLGVVWNCMLLTEGWDLPACSCVILARPTQSRSLYKQIVGRGLRSAPGKSDCIILDHVGAVHRFGLPDEPESYSLDRALPAPMGQLWLCMRCATVVREEHTECPSCQWRQPEGRYARTRSGGPRDQAERVLAVREAVQLQAPRPLTLDERREFYFDRLSEARHEGHSIGWAAHRYRDRFGTYPPRPWLDAFEQLERAEA